MTGVETIARIRFEHFQNGKGINLCVFGQGSGTQGRKLSVSAVSDDEDEANTLQHQLPNGLPGRPYFFMMRLRNFSAAAALVKKLSGMAIAEFIGASILTLDGANDTWSVTLFSCRYSDKAPAPPASRSTASECSGPARPCCEGCWSDPLGQTQKR